MQEEGSVHQRPPVRRLPILAIVQTFFEEISRSTPNELEFMVEYLREEHRILHAKVLKTIGIIPQGNR